jgi:hypothetical protein
MNEGDTIAFVGATGGGKIFHHQSDKSFLWY